MIFAQNEDIVSPGARVVGKSMKCCDCKRRSWARTAPSRNYFCADSSVSSVVSRRSVFAPPIQRSHQSPNRWQIPYKAPCLSPSTRRDWLPLSYPYLFASNLHGWHLPQSVFAPASVPASSIALSDLYLHVPCPPFSLSHLLPAFLQLPSVWAFVLLHVQ